MFLKIQPSCQSTSMWRDTNQYGYLIIFFTIEILLLHLWEKSGLIFVAKFS